MTEPGSAELPLTQLSRLDGKVAVITGAAQGIGLAMARRFSEAGASVVLADLNENVADVAAGLREEGRKVSHANLDVSQESEHDRLAQAAVDEFGGLDIWVNNAGIFPNTKVMEMDSAEWRKVLAVNLDGAFHGSRAAARHMLAHGSGVILNVGSTSGFRVANDGMAHYATSKTGLRGLIRALARELGPSGLRVLGVAPVMTKTPTTMNEERYAAHSAASRAAHLEKYVLKIPLRRVATADDIALVGLFAVSDLAGFVTGTVIPVDGGYLAV